AKLRLPTSRKECAVTKPTLRLPQLCATALASLAALGYLALAPRVSLAAAPAQPFARIGTLQVPGAPLESFDIGFVNAAGVYAFADRSNGGLDFFEGATGRFLGRATGFVGYSATGGSDASGPNGVVAVGGNEFWAGDGDSTVKAVDLRTKKIIASISTGGKKRADELAYDPRDHLVIAVNNADDPPYVSFISTRTRKVVGRLELERASDGAEQPVWNPRTGLVYISIPSLDDVKAHGAVAVVDPHTYKLVKLMPVERCMPAGLALGPHDDLLLGCSDDAVAAGFPARSFVMSAATGKIVASLPRVGGSDEVWSDLKAGRYYLAAAANTGGPVLGVVDSRTNRWIGNWPTGPHAHSVAADPVTGKVFVPIAAGSAADCARGCVAVFGSRQ
ncbi:MAG: YncE family protein, partial [Steroidobacteraceae bacterium]